MTFKKTFSAFLCAALVSSQAFAQDPPPDIKLPKCPDKENVAAYAGVCKGYPATISGVIFSPLAVAWWLAERNAIPERIEIEVKQAVAVERAQCGYSLAEAKTKCSADVDIMKEHLKESERVNAALVERIDDAESSANNVPLWVGLAAGGGFIVGVGLTVLVAYAVSSAAN